MRAAGLLAICFLGQAALAADTPKDPVTPELRAATLHAEGLEQPLRSLRAVMVLLEACKDRFDIFCSESQKDAVWNSKLIAKIALAKHFQIEDQKIRSSAGYHEFRERVYDYSDAVVNGALGYSILLLGRYGAALDACPPKDVAHYRSFFANMKELTFRSYARLDDAHYQETLATIDQQQLLLAETLRKSWTPSECAAFGDLGETLVGSLMMALEAWGTDKPPPDGREAQRVAASRFVLGAALELEMRFRPESKAELRELNRAN